MDIKISDSEALCPEQTTYVEVQIFCRFMLVFVAPVRTLVVLAPFGVLECRPIWRCLDLMFHSLNDLELHHIEVDPVALR